MFSLFKFILLWRYFTGTACLRAAYRRFGPVFCRSSTGFMELTMKLTNFSDALVSIVLAQSALLVMKGIEKASYYDGVFGVLVGIAVIIIGIISVFRLVKGKLENVI